ncbi:hypothetical protein FE257_002332 [Aspergillus nanangensis]|uniref:Prenylcysteine lyase domain-containing protein n=1 Tax=Aspergillus nanangensis TaxID=2582783 RepID=A0AAD4CD14_ASPNN|nr:hypothetical protein FE257_002332 [Aspergillus nanangensis]
MELSLRLWLLYYGVIAQYLIPFSNADQQQQHVVTSDSLSKPKQVAIIGAGAAGSSTAYALRKYADQTSIPLNITVFERNSYIGGRSTTVDVFDDPSYPIELGASIFVKVNTNLVNASRDLGLSIKSASDTRPKETDDTLGVWDGEQFLFILKDTYSWWNVAKLIWRYGWAPVRTQNLMKSTVQKFMRLYEPPFFPFASLSSAAEAVGLLNSTSTPGEVFLADNDVSSDFARDIIQASTRVNYGQNLPLIHGLEAIVCMATDGAMAIDGGNWQIFDGMLRSSNSDVRVNQSVSAITRNNPDETWTVKYQTSDATGTPNREQSLSFDEVVIAGPLQYSDISITPPLPHIPDDIPFVKLHVTLFSSPHRLSTKYFNSQNPPETILTTLPPGTNLGSTQKGVGPAGFWSISTLRTVNAPDSAETHYVYKIFSPEQVTAEFLGNILGLNDTDAHTAADTHIGDLPKHDISWYHEKIWRPYPYLYPRVTFEEPVLAPNLWYTGGIESFISTMETSALMGKNVAALIAQSWEVQDEVMLGDDPVLDRTEL